MLYKLSPSAQRDLIEIFNYTTSVWGEKQAEKYLHSIYGVFENISAGQALYKTVMLSNKRVYSIHHEKHYIIFSVNGCANILGIMHEKMDFLSRMRERLVTKL